MAQTINSLNELPALAEAPWLVICHDNFMSGWGLAQGKSNMLILPCTDWGEARQVRAYAQSRSDMSNVRAIRHNAIEEWVVFGEPCLWQIMLREESPAWYPTGK